MNKLKKLRIRLVAALLGCFVLGILAVGYGVSAYQSEQAAKVVAEAGSVVNFNEAPVQSEPEEQTLGAMAQDLSSSNLLDVNGFQTFVLVGQMGQGYSRATTTVAFADPFKIATTTGADVVIDSVSDAYGYTGATSTVSLVEITGKGVTTTAEYDCSASANAYTTSTPTIVNTEQRINTSTPFIVRSGMASSTNPGAGSFVQDTGITGQVFPVTQILLTPTKPYLVCRVWQPYGTTLGTFTDGTGTAAVEITAKISRNP